MRGTWGLSAAVDDTDGLWVQDDAPDDEIRYRARFYFDPNGFDPGEALGHRRTRIFVAFQETQPGAVAAIVLRRISGAYALMGRTRAGRRQPGGHRLLRRSLTSRTTSS